MLATLLTTLYTDNNVVPQEKPSLPADSEAAIVAKPSRDPANDDSMVGMFNEILGKMLQNLDDCLPARVIAFDRSANRVSVQPLIQVITTQGERVTRGQIDGLPVLQIGGGGFGLFFNLRKGDLGWIKANDRDISLYLSTGQESQPNTARKHTFSDALFIPDVQRDFTIDSEDGANAVLQSTTGYVRVSLFFDKLKLTVGDKSILLSDTGAVITGDTTVVGNFEVQGQSDFNGTIKNNGVNIGSTHKHGGVANGTGNTGVPN